MVCLKPAAHEAKRRKLAEAQAARILPGQIKTHIDDWPMELRTNLDGSDPPKSHPPTPFLSSIVSQWALALESISGKRKHVASFVYGAYKHGDSRLNGDSDSVQELMKLWTP